MYKLTKPLLPTLPVSCVIRTTDGAAIPFDPANTDYQEYLKWVEAGKTPEPADEPVAE